MEYPDDYKNRDTAFHIIWDGIRAFREGSFWKDMNVGLFPHSHRLYWMGSLVGTLLFLFTVLMTLLGITMLMILLVRWFS